MTSENLNKLLISTALISHMLTSLALSLAVFIKFSHAQWFSYADDGQNLSFLKYKIFDLHFTTNGQTNL